jgi:hypothetical protein
MNLAYLEAWLSAPMLFALGVMRGMERQERQAAEIIILAEHRVRREKSWR